MSLLCIRWRLYIMFWRSRWEEQLVWEEVSSLETVKLRTVWACVCEKSKSHNMKICHRNGRPYSLFSGANSAVSVTGRKSGDPRHCEHQSSRDLGSYSLRQSRLQWVSIIHYNIAFLVVSSSAILCKPLICSVNIFCTLILCQVWGWPGRKPRVCSPGVYRSSLNENTLILFFNFCNCYFYTMK